MHRRILPYRHDYTVLMESTLMDDDGKARAGSQMLHLKRGALAFYYIAFIAISVLTVIGVLFGDPGDSLVGLPMVFILGLAIFTDRRSIHVPPEMIVLVIVAFFIALASRGLDGDNVILEALGHTMTGINLGLLGLILVYILLKSMPGIRDENRRVVAFISVCIALASYTMVCMAQYLVQTALDRNVMPDTDGMMVEMASVLLGSVIVGAVYDFRRSKNLFGGIVNSFLEENSEFIGMDDMQRNNILRLIEEGESEWLEFKSTLRTNLQTGETDKRMEKAVLKTIVAFLNSEGGDLLVGVADDGEIIGADVASFGNKDKMGLHLSNLMSSQIGSAFLPCISFFMVDFGDKTVIRVKVDRCAKPAFLKDGKTELFYVRKGPQSEELTGMSLISYVNNRGKKRGKRF